MKKLTACLALVLAALIAAPALAQDHGSDGGCGDLFGDLIHIKRHATSGVPILAKRWISFPEGVYGWGYCPIAVREDRSEIGFVDLSCDPAEPAIAVDYFGRLSAGRTKERNLRMHFNEAIENIKMAQAVGLDPAGRLMLTFPPDPLTGETTTKVIDSPVENIALYHRLMKYGHFGTDPMEQDWWAHPPVVSGEDGDGTEPNVQYQPSLDATDYAKFEAADLEYLLPGAYETCLLENVFTCADPQPLTADDMLRAASFLATGADKGGKVTLDLLQYMNRILKITTTTKDPDGHVLSEATVAKLPALVKDCGLTDPVQITLPDGTLTYEEPNYPAACPIGVAPAGAAFPASELFVDFSPVLYSRTAVWLSQTLDVIKTQDNRSFVLALDVPLFQYLEFKNAGLGSGTNIDGFVKSANDALRSVEFLHNYAVPEDLGWRFNTVTRTK